MLFFLIIWYSVFGNWYQNLRWIQLRMQTSIRAESGWITRSKSIESHHCCFYWKITYLLMWGGYTGWSRSYRKSVLEFCVSVLGRLSDLQYIFAVTSGSPSMRISTICQDDNLPYDLSADFNNWEDLIGLLCISLLNYPHDIESFHTFYI
mgnify:CR=1 FL=1